MATDFGLNNNAVQNRYFEFPNNSQWGIVAPRTTPHTQAAMLQVVDDSGSFYGYYHSTGPWGNVNALNMYHGETGSSDANDLQVRYGTSNAVNRSITAPDGTLGDGQWRLFAHRVPSGGQNVSYINIDGANVRPTGGSNVDTENYAPAQVLFGTRVDFQTDRYFKNRLAWYAQWVGYSLTDQDMIDLANGTITPFELQNSFLTVLIDFADHNTVRDLVTGDTPTKNGTGYVNVPQPYPAAPEQPFTGYVSHSII